MHYTQIGRYESKGVKPSGEVLAKIANALGVTSDYLMSGSSQDQAEAALTDRELLNQFQKVEQLPQDKKGHRDGTIGFFSIEVRYSKSYGIEKPKRSAWASFNVPY